jgi:hypothetical protein
LPMEIHYLKILTSTNILYLQRKIYNIDSSNKDANTYTVYKQIAFRSPNKDSSTFFHRPASIYNNVIMV